MKSMLVACLIVIALLVSCKKDNPVDPNIDPNKFTTVNVYYVQFNTSTNDWDMSTKRLGNIIKIDHKGSMYKRFYNDNFTKNTKTFHSFLLGETNLFRSFFDNVGCLVSDSIVGIDLTTYSYSNDATGYLTKRNSYISSPYQVLIDNYVGDNGKITYNNVNDILNTYYEWGSNGLVSRTYTLDDKNQKVYRRNFYHDNNGFVTKVVDSLSPNGGTVFTETFSYDSQGQLTELNRDEQAYSSLTNYNTKFYYSNDGYLIKYRSTSTEDGFDAEVTIAYNNDHYPSETIITPLSGNSQKMKAIFEYKTE